MANSRISFVSNILIPILTGIITLVLFLLFRPENAGALFYTNMIYTLLLEGFLFGFFESATKREQEYFRSILQHYQRRCNLLYHIR